MGIDFQLVLRHAGMLQRATTLRELVQVTWAVVCGQTRFRTTWLALMEPGDPEHLRIVQALGSNEEIVLARCPLVPLAGDPMVQELMEGRAPVLVLDAATDPRTNKAIVATLGNRTILNVPLVLGPMPMPVGILGVGTFGDEGVLEPTRDELDLLVVLATQLAGAYTRMQLLDQQRSDAEARVKLERHLEAVQRVELMGVLTSGVAHDLNNFLAAAQLNLDLITPVAADLEAMADARIAMTRAHDVVQQLLQLGRGQPALGAPVNLNDRVLSTLKLVRSSIPRGVRVTHGALTLPIVRGNAVQIDQALANLLINARDAVGLAGQITVEVDERVLGEEFVRANRWARAGRYGRVRVGDSGAGIAPELLERIFDPLFSTKATGTGLGLAVVSRVVAQHEGLLHCESQPGLGTAFSLYLPLS